MDNNLQFNSINDLYQRIYPSLNTKICELKRIKINYLTEKDIWNYCIKEKWNNKSNLRIHELVDDILNLDPLRLTEFYKINIKK